MTSHSSHSSHLEPRHSSEASQHAAVELHPRTSSDGDTNGLEESTQEHTMIASEDPHENSLFNNRTSLAEETGYTADEKTTDGILDPLRSRPDAPELTVVVEDGDITDAGANNLYTPLEKKPSPISSKHGSHLHLNLKPPSPQPWDLVDPPDTDDAKGNPDYDSTLGSRKFRTLQSTTHTTRPLIPKSSYYFGPPPSDSAFFTPPVGRIGIHHPREIIRIERDYTGGELVQFAPIYPLELEGRITPTHFLESINAINELLISAHSLRHSFLDNTIAVLTFQLSRLFLTSHYDKASVFDQMIYIEYLTFDAGNATTLSSN
ncbi:hypothetical protein H0H92_008707 [Tricholoma furcatifolium]|nr:hypothetical protein H0H92_008707 [Tricholoma furcatifolium]